MKSFALFMRELGAGDGMGVEMSVIESSTGIVKVSIVVLYSIISSCSRVVTTDEIATVVERLMNVKKVVFDTSSSAMTRWSVRMVRRSMTMEALPKGSVAAIVVVMVVRGLSRIKARYLSCRCWYRCLYRYWYKGR